MKLLQYPFSPIDTMHNVTCSLSEHQIKHNSLLLHRHNLRFPFFCLLLFPAQWPRPTRIPLPAFGAHTGSPIIITWGPAVVRWYVSWFLVANNQPVPFSSFYMTKVHLICAGQREAPSRLSDSKRSKAKYP